MRIRDFYAQGAVMIRIEDRLLQKLGTVQVLPMSTERKSTESELASLRRLRARLKDEHLRHRRTKCTRLDAPPARQKEDQVYKGAHMGPPSSTAPGLSKQEEQVESPGTQSGLGGSQERPDVAPEPTFPTDIRARTRSDIGLSADGKAETTSVTADSRKLDEGETVVLAIHPLKIGSSEVGNCGYRQVMEDALEDHDEQRKASAESCAATVDTQACTSAGAIPDAVAMQGECQKLDLDHYEKLDLDPDGLVSCADEQQARRDQQQLLAAMRAKKASTTAAELPTNLPTTVGSDATGLSPNTQTPHDALGDGGAADVGGVVGHQTRDIDDTRPTGGPISTEVLEAAGAAGVSDTDPARHMCIVDDSEDYTPSRTRWALVMLQTKDKAQERLRAGPLRVARLMHIKEQAEKRLTANSKLSDGELNSKLKRECAHATRNYLCAKS